MRLSTVRNTFIALALTVAGWTTYVTTRPEPMMVTYMIDDAFYYLVPAHAFADKLNRADHTRVLRTLGRRYEALVLLESALEQTGLDPIWHVIRDWAGLQSH